MRLQIGFTCVVCIIFAGAVTFWITDRADVTKNVDTVKAMATKNKEDIKQLDSRVGELESEKLFNKAVQELGPRPGSDFVAVDNPLRWERATEAAILATAFKGLDSVYRHSSPSEIRRGTDCSREPQQQTN